MAPRSQGCQLRRDWENLFAGHSREYPALAEQLNHRQRRLLPDDWDADLPHFAADPRGSQPATPAGLALAHAAATRTGGTRALLIATGSEVAMAVEAFKELAADGIRARVVSMPSMELFDRQPRRTVTRSCLRR